MVKTRGGRCFVAIKLLRGLNWKMCYVKTIEVLGWYYGKYEWGMAVAADALEIDVMFTLYRCITDYSGRSDVW